MSERDGLGKKGLLGLASLSAAATLLACLGSLYITAHGNNTGHRYGVVVDLRRDLRAGLS